MSLKCKKFNLSSLYFLPVIVIVFIIAIICVPGKTLAFDNEKVADFNDNWTTIGSDNTVNTFSLPVTLNSAQPKISKIVPDNLSYPVVLCFRSSHQKIKVFCDGEQIYSFGFDDFSMFGKSPGSAYNLVRLPKESAGKVLTLEFYSPYPNYSGKIDTIQTGSKAALIFSLLRKHTLGVLTTFIIFVSGIVTLIAYYFIIRKDSNSTKETLYLGFFAIFISLWLFAESRLTQFFLIPPAANTCFTFIAMLATPIPLIKYISSSQYATKRKLLNILAEISAIIMLVSVLLQVFNVVDFMEQIYYLNFCLVVTCCIILYAVISDTIHHKNVARKRLLLSIGILMVFFVLETVLLYIGGHVSGNMMRIGVLVFIALQASSAFNTASGIMHLSHLAGEDALTHCQNRTIYNRMLDDCDAQQDIAIVIADINNLKTINDTFGHAFGDEAIIKCANSFTQTFSPFGNCFRIGGDEFAMIGKNISEQRLVELCEDVQKLCRKIDKETIYPFSISLGCTVYNKDTDHSISDTVRRADKLMYENKTLFKQISTADTADC